MFIADKPTLDDINNKVDRLCNYIGNKITESTIQYYLLSGNKILCDKSKITVTQSTSVPETSEDGYIITNTGYAYITATNSDIDSATYIIV